MTRRASTTYRPFAGALVALGCGMSLAACTGDSDDSGDDPTIAANYFSAAAAGATRSISPYLEGYVRFDNQRGLVLPRVNLRVYDRAVTRKATSIAAENLGIPPDATDSDGLRVPRGSELVAVTLSLSRGAYAGFPANGSAAGANDGPAVEVEAAGTRRRIAMGQLPKAPGRGVIVAAVVRQGAPVRAIVTDLGRTAGLDVRTGMPLSDVTSREAAALPTGLVGLGPERNATGTTRSTNASVDRLSGPASQTVTFDFPRARGDVVKWAPRLGWAPTGRAWLVLSVRVRVTNELRFSVASGVTVPAAGFTLVAAGSKPVAARNDLTSTIAQVTEVPAVAFDMPLAARSFTLRVDAGRATFADNRWTRTPKPVSIRFTLAS